MKINLSESEKDRELILKYYNEKGLTRAIEMSVASGFQLIVVYTFLQEDHGGYEEKIQELIDFYGYKEVGYFNKG